MGMAGSMILAGRAALVTATGGQVTERDDSLKSQLTSEPVSGSPS